MGDSDEDYDNHKRHGTQSGRNKFRKERDELEESSFSKLTSASSMTSRESGASSNGSGNALNKHNRYNSTRRSDRSYSPPSRNERSSPPPPTRRSNGYQQQHHYGSGGHYNSNRYEYGAFNPNLNNRNDENGFKRSRSAYEGSYNSTNSYENSFYDSLSNKKLRRDWSVLEGPAGSSSHSKYYEHDNRTDLDDLSDELAPHEYNRLNRPSNYSSYNDFSSNGNQNFYQNNYSNMPFNNSMHHFHHHHHQPNPMMMGYRNQFNNFPNNIPPTPYMQPMYPMQPTATPFVNPLLTSFSSDYDGQTQPQMLSFKQFMTGLQAENNDISISQDAAMKRYNDYKNAFRREQISLFYAVHKNEDWFKCRYHPDDSARRKDEQRESIKRRLKLFLGLVEKFCKKNEQDTNGFELSLDATNEIDKQNLYKFIDAVIIKLEDGSDSDLDILEEIYTVNHITTHLETINNDKPPSPLPPPPPKVEVNETTTSKSEEVKEDEPMNMDKLDKVSDDESGMGSNDNSDDDEDDDDDENTKTVDSKFDRKKKTKRAKKTNSEQNEENETNSDKLTETSKLEIVVDTTTTSKEEKKVETVKENGEKPIEKSKPTIPHKTQSIFFKHLPVNVTRQDLEEIGRKFPGFKRAAISEPAPERRFQRRGWISYDSTVDIKDICTKINGLKLHEMLLNATINREIDQKVKYIIGFTNDKAIVRNDLKLIARVVDNMDRRWGLWQYNDLYSNNKLNDEDFKLAYDRKKSKENNKKKSTDSSANTADATNKASDSKSDTSVIDENNDSKMSDSTSEQTNELVKEAELVAEPVVEPSLPVTEEEKPIVVKNPFVEEANEYLKYLSELKEEDRGDDTDLKELLKSPKRETKQTDEEVASVENDTNLETNNESSTKSLDESKSKSIALNKAFKLEKGLKAAKLLDKLILYLRIVHSIDYYNVTEYQQEDWMPNRCGIIHGRGSTEPKSTQNIVNILNGININYFDVNALKKVQIDEWLRLFEASIKSYVDYRERIDLEIARRLGLKDLPVEIEKFITTNCQKVEKDIWLCPLSGKKFKGPDYVRKHIETKHRDRLLELRRDVEYFNRFVLDPKRPYLPEHPLTKNATMINNQPTQMNMPYPEFYRPNMYPGMGAPNAPFNQYQSPYPPFNSQPKNIPNQFSSYHPMYNQQTQPYSSHKPRR